MTDAEIAALKAAAKVATRGKWVAGHKSDCPPGVSVHIPYSDDGSWWIATVFDAAKGVSAANNAAYIALANPDAILALIARLETAERNYNALKQAFDENPNAAWVRMHKAEARAERLAAVLEAEREERRAERAVQEAENAMCRAQERDDLDAERRHVKWHADACEALNLAHQRAEAARAALATERGEAEGGEP